jgi:hypothetical protein
MRAIVRRSEVLEQRRHAASDAWIGVVERENGHAALGASRWEAICGAVGDRRDRSIGRKPGLGIRARPFVLGEGRG